MKPLIRAFAALLLCALLPLSTGCAWVGDKLNGLGQETEPPVGEPPGTGLETPPPGGKNDSGFGKENPVSAMYSGFLKTERKAFSGLYDAVFDSGEREAHSLFLRLLSETAELSEICSALYALPEAENSASIAFTGEVSGPCAGSGSIEKSGAFEFVFTGGERASGSIGENKLVIKTGDAALLLTFENGRYALRSDRKGESFLAYIGEEGVTAALLGEAPAGDGVPAEDELPDGARILRFYEGRLEPAE